MITGNTEPRDFELEFLRSELSNELTFGNEQIERAEKAEVRGFILGWLMGVAFAAALLVSIWS